MPVWQKCTGCDYRGPDFGGHFAASHVRDVIPRDRVVRFSYFLDLSVAEFYQALLYCRLLKGISSCWYICLVQSSMKILNISSNLTPKFQLNQPFTSERLSAVVDKYLKLDIGGGDEDPDEDYNGNVREDSNMTSANCGKGVAPGFVEESR